MNNLTKAINSMNKLNSRIITEKEREIIKVISECKSGITIKDLSFKLNIKGFQFEQDIFNKRIEKLILEDRIIFKNKLFYITKDN